MPSLSNEWIQKLYKSAEARGLFAQGDTLRAVLPPDVSGVLPVVPAAGPRIMSDLIHLNRMAVNRPEPFADWLRTASVLAAAYGPVEVFDDAVTLLLPTTGPVAAPTTPAVSTPKPTASGPALAALEDLLCAMFSADELRRLLRYTFPEVAEQVPDGGSLRGTVSATVAQLQKEGALGPVFFDAVRKERPRRTAEIDAVVSRLG